MSAFPYSDLPLPQYPQYPPIPGLNGLNSKEQEQKAREQRRMVSDVWEYCTRVNDSLVKCNTCGKIMSFHGTTNIRVHVGRHFGMKPIRCRSTGRLPRMSDILKPGGPVPQQLKSPHSPAPSRPKSPPQPAVQQPKKTYAAPSQPAQRASLGKEQKLAPKPAKPQAPTEVCLRWNSYHSNMQNTFPSLLNNEQFVDVTLACDGRSIKCHKVMLSACSPYLEELLSANPCQHPIIFLKDMKFWQLAALVDFMYRGEVNVTQDKLPSLLSAAEALQIKGLASPVNAPSSPSRSSQHELPESVGLLQQFQSEIKTEMDDDDEYFQDTDDSLPPVTPKIKKRKMSDVSSAGGSGSQQQQGKKPKERERGSGGLNMSLPTHYAPPPSAHAHQRLDDTSYPPDTTYQNCSMEMKMKPDDLTIDEDQAQMILEQYAQDGTYVKEEEDSYGSG